jgi:hypothetical protein
MFVFDIRVLQHCGTALGVDQTLEMLEQRFEWYGKILRSPYECDMWNLCYFPAFDPSLAVMSIPVIDHGCRKFEQFIRVFMNDSPQPLMIIWRRVG